MMQTQLKPNCNLRVNVLNKIVERGISKDRLTKITQELALKTDTAALNYLLLTFPHETRRALGLKPKMGLVKCMQH